jgi:hypothetical protein
MRNVANKQGGIIGKSNDGTDGMNDSIVNDTLSASDADLREDAKLENKSALCVSVYRRVEHDPSFQKNKCPVTPGVPARLD